MANKFPYVASAGPLVKTVNQLRKSFPKEVNVDILRKIGVAPKNESYVINVLRFIGIIDETGKKVEAKAKAFVQHQDDAFSTELGKIVKDAYSELFEIHNDGAWTLDRSSLTQFFRTSDHSSDVVGSRQAATFAALAALSGHAEVPAPKATPSVKKGTPAKRSVASERANNPVKPQQEKRGEEPKGAAKEDSAQSVGLTVRIEVNLPASGDQDTYDRIFQSIRKNLINGP